MFPLEEVILASFAWSEIYYYIITLKYILDGCSFVVSTGCPKKSGIRFDSYWLKEHLDESKLGM